MLKVYILFLFIVALKLVKDMYENNKNKIYLGVKLNLLSIFWLMSNAARFCIY